MSKILKDEQEEYLQSFREEPDALIKEMEEFARERKIPILGWHSAEFLEQIIKLKKPKAILELGTAIGYSTIRMRRIAEPDCKVETIEKSTPNIALAKGNFEKAGLTEGIVLHEGDALDIMPKLKGKYDLIFLDADKEDYENLFKLSLELLSDDDGVMFVDNLLWQGFAAAKEVPKKFLNSSNNIRAFNRLFMSEESLTTTLLPIGDGIGLGIKNKRTLI